MIRGRSSAAGGPELDRFLRQSMRDRLPYDEMVRRLLTAVGTPGHDGAVGYFTAAEADPLEMAGVVSQTLLGIRTKCARCHDHPFDHWSQREYYGLAAFFGETRSVSGSPNRPVRMVESASQRVAWPPQDGPNAGGSPAAVEPSWPLSSEAADEPALAEAIERGRRKKEPTDDQVIEELLVEAIASASPRDGLGIESAVLPTGNDRKGSLRRSLADRVTDPLNRSFARNLVSRLWATLVGRGLVEPVDDFRDDNPPRHPDVLDHLADELVAGGHDIRLVVTLIVSSHAYARGRATDEDPKRRRQLEDACLATPLRPLPTVASQLKHATIVRSLVGESADHGGATHHLLTSYPRVRELVHPSLGSIVADQVERLGDLPAFVSVGGSYAAAVRLMGSPALAAFDVDAEPVSVRESYGDTRFGRGCLLARRLVERGVRFVQVNLGGFDTHANNFPTMRSLGAVIDPAIGTLLGDLASSGRLDRTIVLLLSEFGRTPVINGSAGRDHYPDVFSSLVAGGGIKRGFVLGGTDPEGREASQRPVRIADLHATIVSQLGIDPEKRVDTALGRRMKLVNDGTVVSDMTA